MTAPMDHAEQLHERGATITTLWMRGIAVACVLAAIGCANNVAQDRMTGPDGRLKGAKPIKLENGEGATNGIVTYPGGDRVDWKYVELPTGKKGRLDFEMKWTTPRPGLQLGFDVFDQWNNPVANAKGSKGRVRDAFVADASGKYFVRVYAKGRGDAGAYKLAVAFREEVSGPKLPPLEIPDPPRLPAVPGQPCDPFDVRDPECKTVCPPGGQGAPPNWKPCIDAGVQQPPPPPPVAPPPPPPPPPPKPILSRVIKADVSGDQVILTISAGSDLGVEKTWSGQVMRGDTKTPFPGGRIIIIRVDKQRTIAKVPLTTDIINANPIILLQP
jgi:hypothetical protein